MKLFTDQLAVMQDITTRIDGLCDLLNDLMLFARPRPLQVTTFHLRALIDDGVAFLKRDESLRTIEVTIDGRITAHLVFFDRHGWYCEHGRTCPAVGHAKKYNGQIARVS